MTNSNLKEKLKEAWKYEKNTSMLIVALIFVISFSVPLLTTIKLSLFMILAVICRIGYGIAINRYDS